uniref:Reverse transcriptase domain-containing protein n=1 Tax=Graphocephala atropunctata TaxID=36148 RepID=A0A1B6LBJ4_9HEMI
MNNSKIGSQVKPYYFKRPTSKQQWEQRSPTNKLEKQKMRKEMYKIKIKINNIDSGFWLKKGNSTCSLPSIKIQLGKNLTENVLVDTGSSINLINEPMLNQLIKNKIVRKIYTTGNDCYTATNDTIQILGRCIVKIKINRFSWFVKFLIGKNITWNMILGSSFIRDSGMLIDLSKNQCNFKFCPDIKISLSRNTKKMVNNVNTDIKIGCNEASVEIGRLIKEYPNVFTTDIGEAIDFQYEIKLKDKEVVRLRPYPLGLPKMKQLKEIIDDLLRQNIIRPSLSSYSSPTFLVQKPGSDKQRMVVNYSKLNSKLERVNYPIGDLHDTYHYLEGAEYFTVLDLSNSFHQIKLSENCKHLTSFSTPFSSYEWIRVPYGLHCGSGLLSSYINRVLCDIKFKFVMNFVDDLIISPRTLEEHIMHLMEVVRRLSDHHLTVNPSKVKFVYKESKFFGS